MANTGLVPALPHISVHACRCFPAIGRKSTLSDEYRPDVEPKCLGRMVEGSCTNSCKPSVEEYGACRLMQHACMHLDHAQVQQPAHVCNFNACADDYDPALTMMYFS